MGKCKPLPAAAAADAKASTAAAVAAAAATVAAIVRWCRLTPVEPRVESAWFQRWNHKPYRLLSSFALTFSLRHYAVAAAAAEGKVKAKVLSKSASGLWEHGRGSHSSPTTRAEPLYHK